MIEQRSIRAELPRLVPVVTGFLLDYSGAEIFGPR
jgi:hypothetical protein